MITKSNLHKLQILTLFIVSSLTLGIAGPTHLLREISSIDNPDILSPSTALEKNFDVLFQKTPSKKNLDLKPWANKSWKLDSGLIANRYKDGGFSTRFGWKSRRNYIENHPANEVLQISDAQKRTQAIDKLSASEKYDLLVGDPLGTLTRSQWIAGEKYWQDKTMANWMGICEGSAAAGALYPEPHHAVDFKTEKGDTLRFHVMDIKGLAALLWSSYNAQIPISGSRCGSHNAKTDSKGVVINESCFNSNPASFHIAVMNFLGLRDRPFFINRVTGVEVWNVPVIGYQVRYYKPTSSRVAESFSDAKVHLSDYTRDQYRGHRSSQAVSVVGVEMRIQITKGSTNSRDSSEISSLDELSYRYDLELDSSANIVGGEWHQKNHPDFMWAVEPNFRPLSVGDISLGASVAWDGNRVPESWLPSVQRASEQNQPLEKIVTKLIELSRQ